MNIDPTKIYEKLTSAGEEWVHLDACARLLEEAQKPELCTLMIGFIDKGKSAAESEARARATPEYKAHVKAMVDAREAANEARVKYEAAKCWFEAVRTQAANMRNESRMTT